MTCESDVLFEAGQVDSGDTGGGRAGDPRPNRQMETP